MELETIADSLFKVLPDLLPKLLERVQRRRSEPDPESKLEELGKLLTGRLVYLLRYLDQTGDARYPHAYGRVLGAYVDVGSARPPASFSSQAEPAWEHASKYACWYLSALGLVANTARSGVRSRSTNSARC